MKNWCEELFGTRKPILAMCHCYPMPSDPNYNEKNGVDWIVEKALHDVTALQEGGVDAVMFSNEGSQPWLLENPQATLCAMAHMIGILKRNLRIPFGVHVIWDPMATIDLAAATGAQYVREVFTGAYASDYGIWDTSVGDILRHRRNLDAGHVKLLFNITPEAAAYMGERSLKDITRTTIFNGSPDGLCVSGITAGEETSTQDLATVKEVSGDVPVFANTGVQLDNVEEQLSYADGAVVGTYFKKDGYIWNDVDKDRVKAFMDRVKSFRKN